MFLTFIHLATSIDDPVVNGAGNNANTLFYLGGGLIALMVMSRIFDFFLSLRKKTNGSNGKAIYELLDTQKEREKEWRDHILSKLAVLETEVSDLRRTSDGLVSKIDKLTLTIEDRNNILSNLANDFRRQQTACLQKFATKAELKSFKKIKPRRT